MNRKILIVTASDIEARALENLVPANSRFDAEVIKTGVGTMATAYRLMSYLRSNHPPHLAINAGIAGSFTSVLPVGSIAIIEKDCLADFGIDNRGEFVPAVSARLTNPRSDPFGPGGWIECNNNYTKQLAGKFHFASGITSDTVSGSSERIELLRSRFNPCIESMEGASFFYICALEKIPFLAIRAVSNMVEERDRHKWDIPLALRSLREKTREILNLLFIRE